MNILKYIIISILSIIVVAWFAGQYYLSGSQAQYHGEAKLDGLSATVEVTFDARGIPQIWADTDKDMYTTLGYLHASERLFQMELIRRVSHGKLSAMIGKAGLEFDKTARKLGFAAKAKRDYSSVNKKTLSILDAYTNGVNQWIEQSDVLPPEFELLSLKPIKWTAKQILTITIYQTWYSHALMDKDSSYSNLIAALGDDIKQKLNSFKSWSPTTVSDSFIDRFFSGEAFPLRGTKASNSWLVSPKKSKSGAAIHSSDPHLVVNSVPNFWYIAGMHSKEGSNFVGVTLPSLPVALMGHNESISFAFTVASVDLNDYYEVRKIASDSVRIFGKAEALKKREELILVNGGSSETHTILETSLGPVLSENDSNFTVVHWAGYDFNYGDVVNSMTKLINVKNFKEFRQVVTRTGALDVNWTYSDKLGNIAYQLGAPIPRREKNDTYSLQSADDLSAKWKGYYPLDSIPFSYNPKQNFISSNNNQLVSEKFPISVPGFYDPYRIVRATELLSSEEKFSMEDMQRFQMDNFSVLASRHKARLAAAAKKLDRDDISERLLNWDSRIELDDDLPSILTAWIYYLPKFILEDDLGAEWKIAAAIVEELIADSANALFDNRITDKIEKPIDIYANCLRFVLESYEGADFEDIMQLEIKHPFTLNDSFQATVLDYFFGLNHGPFGIAADQSVLNVAYFTKKKDELGFSVQIAPSMRYVLDWADIDSFSMIINMGQSGNPFSPHYDDFIDYWREGKTWTIPFTKDIVYKNRQSLLRLNKQLK